MTDAPTGPKPTMSASTLAAALRATAARPEGLWLPARGRSMGRTIASGAEIHIEAVTAAPVPGEVWAFCTTGGLVLVHRCRVTGPPHLFRGDARIEDDGPVDAGLLVGRADRVRDAESEHPMRAASPLDRAVVGARRAARVARRLLTGAGCSAQAPISSR